MAKLYEKAWNQTVESLNDWKKDIIINNFPYESRQDRDISSEVARDAARLAEKWEREMNGKTTTPAP